MSSELGTRIDTLLFDYGGVIADEGFRDGLSAIARQQGLDPEELVRQAMDAVYDSGYVLGRGSEDDFWRLLKSRTGLSGEKSGLEAEIWSRFRLRPAMIAWVDRLRASGFRVALLSDQTDWLERLDRRDGFLAHFDRVFNSYHLGIGKRNPRIFRMVACRMGRRPEQILFVDDSPGNVQRAESVGMNALLFQDEETFAREMVRRFNVSGPS